MNHEIIHQVVGFNYDGPTFNVHRICCEEHLREVVASFPNVYPNTIAYTNTLTAEERPDCWGDVFVLAELNVNTAAHEAVHLASGIAARQGQTALVLTEDVATEFEEIFCQMVGEITDKIAGVMDGAYGDQ